MCQYASRDVLRLHRITRALSTPSVEVTNFLHLEGATQQSVHLPTHTFNLGYGYQLTLTTVLVAARNELQKTTYDECHLIQGLTYQCAYCYALELWNQVTALTWS